MQVSPFHPQTKTNSEDEFRRRIAKTNSSKANSPPKTDSEDEFHEDEFHEDEFPEDEFPPKANSEDEFPQEEVALRRRFPPKRRGLI